MIRNSIQVIPIRRDLCSRVILCEWRCPAYTWRKGRGHVVRQVQTLHREIHLSFNLFCKMTFHREALEMDQQYWRQPRQRQQFRRFPQGLAFRAIPVIYSSHIRVLHWQMIYNVPSIRLFHNFLFNECVQTLLKRDLGSSSVRGYRQSQVHESVIRCGCLRGRD